MSAVLVIAILLGLVLLLLAVPVVAAFRFEGIEPLAGEVAISWLFGLVRLRQRFPDQGKSPSRDAAAQTEGSRSTASRGGGGRALTVLRQAPFRRRILRLVRDLFGAIHLDRLRLQVRLGLGDPADTGRLWALLGPVAAMAQKLRRAEVRIEPEFMDAVLEFQAEGRMRLVPLQFIALAIGFALSPASIRAWRTLAGAHA